MGATRECCAGPYAYCSIYVHWFLSISTSDIKRYNNLSFILILSPQMIIIFKSQQYWVQRDVILQAIMTSTQVSPILSEKLTRNHMEVSVHNPIINFISYVDCQNVAQYTIKASQYILRINPLAWYYEKLLVFGMMQSMNQYLPTNYLFLCVTKCCFKSVHIWPSTS